MKVKVLPFLLSVLMIAGNTIHAAEIYNNPNGKLELFGKVGGFHYFSNDKNINGNSTYMHVGFKGETQVNDQLVGYGQWESQIQDHINNNENNYPCTHIAFVGLKLGNAGSLDYGCNYGVVYDVTSWTNVLPAFGGDTYGDDNFMQQRGKGFATYRNTNFFGLVNGLNFAIQYQGKNDNNISKKNTNNSNNRSSALRQNGDGIGGSIIYNLGEGFGIGGAISSSQRTHFQNKIIFGNGNSAQTYTGGVKYDANNIYLAAQYTKTYNATRAGELGWANKARNFEMVAQYQFDFGLRPSIAYLQSKGKDLDSGYGDQDILKYVDVGATYYFNKSISTYVDYKINLLNANKFTNQAGIGTNDVVALGLIYQF